MEETAWHCQHQQPVPDAASFLLSRLPHPDTAAADVAAFVDAATGRSLSFLALRRGALSLAAGLRLGLGLRRGDAVLILSSLANNSLLLLPQIVLGVLAAGGVVVAAADPDAIAAAHGSRAVIVVAEPGEAAGKAAGAGIPLLLTTRSLDDTRTLSVEELIDGGDPTALDEERPRPSSSDVAFVAASNNNKVEMTHADLMAAIANVIGSPQGGGRVCLASLPMMCSSVHALPLLALGLPAAGVTTVLTPPPSEPRAAREAVAAHGATDVVTTPEAAAMLAAPTLPLDDKLSSLRRVVIVAPVPLPAEARMEFGRRLPWVELTELVAMTEEMQMPQAELGAPPLITQTNAALIQ